MFDLQGKTVTIMGLGVYEKGSGIEAAKFAMRKGANLIITDLRDRATLADQIKRLESYAEQIEYKEEIKWVLEEHRHEDFENTDMIMRNPGVPIMSEYLQTARKNNIPIESDQSIFFKLCPAKITAITGTRGKSTTTSLIAHILKYAGKTTWLGGNIGVSPMSFLDKVKKDDMVVLELSSWLLETIGEHEMSPHIAVFLNVLPDHLNRYDSMQHYADAKALITKFQKEDDILVANYANEYTRNAAMGTKAKFIAYDAETEQDRDGYYIDGVMAVEKKGKSKTEILNINMVPLRGEHNIQNILAAIAVARQFDVNTETIKQAVSSFTALTGRLEFIEEVKQRSFINDTTSSTPVALRAALKAMQGRPTVLITGGQDKELPVDEIPALLAEYPKAIVWMPGSGTEKLKPLLDIPLSTPQAEATTMEEAVRKAYSFSEEGDVILLSPGFTSFASFRNEFERGDAFVESVQKLKQIQS